MIKEGWIGFRIARIVDFCGKLSWFPDFENTVNRGSVVNLARIPECSWFDVRILDPKPNLNHRFFLALVVMLMSSSKLFLFSNEAHFNSGVRLLLELYCVVVVKHVAFFTICAKLTIAFTFTNLPLNCYTSVSGCGCDFGFEQKYWRIGRFGEKRHGLADLHTPIHPH